MKFIVVIVCLISIKSSLSMNERVSPQRMGYFRRSQLPPNLNQRINPHIAKLILLKHLLELDCLMSIYNTRNPQSDRQKSFLNMGLNRMPAFNNKASLSRIRNQIGNDASQTMYFLNPKIIMIPSLKNTAEEIVKNLQKETPINQNQNLPQHSQAPTLNGDQKRKSFQRENNKEDGYSSAAAVTKNSKTGDNKTAGFVDMKIPRIPIYPFSSTSRSTTTIHSSELKSDPVQTYEVEEIFDSAVDVSKSIGYNPMEKDAKNKLWEKHEQEIIDEGFKKMFNEMVTPETTTPSFGNKVSVVGEKTPSVEITSHTKFQPHHKLSPQGGKRLNNTEKNTLKTTPPIKYPNRGNVPLRMPDKGVKTYPNLKFSNKVRENFDLKPSSSTEHFDFAKPDDGKKDKIDIKKMQALSHPFFRLFNKGSPEIPRQKPKNLNLFTSPTTPNSLQKLFDKDSQSLLADNRKIITDNPLTSTVQYVSMDSTSSSQINRTTLNLYIYPLVTPNNSTLESVNHYKGKSTTLTIPQGGSDPPSTTFRSIHSESDMTHETVKGPNAALLSTSVKTDLMRDQESSGKNSRKMHFNQDIKQEPVPNDIVENSETKPRRSDILISDNMKDYVDNEKRVSIQSYLEHLQPNNTIQTHDFMTNVKIDSYIRFIPDILNDIRENKISNEDLSLLSSVFGKYWPDILALSNATELDVLPLLKMKNENDLIKFLESYYSKDIKTFATERSNGKELYDYMEEYKDFYEEMLTEDMGGKRKRYRRKRDNDPEGRQKTEASEEYFKSLTKEKKVKKVKKLNARLNV